MKDYFWEDPYLLQVCADQIIRRCASHSKGWKIIAHCHLGLVEGHYGANKTTETMLKSGFYWPILFQDCQKFVNNCHSYQYARNLS